MSKKPAQENSSKLTLRASDFIPSVFQNFSLLFGRRSKNDKPETVMEASFPPPYCTLPHPRFANESASNTSSASGVKPRVEFIELANFGVVELEVPTEHSGRGHAFEAVELDAPTWCDRCGGCIWSLYQPLQCKNCQLICHEYCCALITVNCPFGNDDASPRNMSTLNNATYSIKKNATSVEALSIDKMSRNEINDLVKRCNTKSPSSQLSVDDDGRTILGFVRVCMNLMRPINVVAGTRPASIYDIIKGGEDGEDTARGRSTLTSFYLPVDTVKALHVDSALTATGVVAALLKKFHVADAPPKYALYESQFDVDTQSCVLRKLAPHERPLCLVISWIDTDVFHHKQLVLQENDDFDISWEMFALPELGNFLRILDREEEAYVGEIRLKYQILGEKIREQLELLELEPPPDDL